MVVGVSQVGSIENSSQWRGPHCNAGPRRAWLYLPADSRLASQAMRLSCQYRLQFIVILMARVTGRRSQKCAWQAGNRTIAVTRFQQQKQHNIDSQLKFNIASDIALLVAQTTRNKQCQGVHTIYIAFTGLRQPLGYEAGL